MIQLDTPPQACFVTNEKPKTEKETHHKPTLSMMHKYDTSDTIPIQYDDIDSCKNMKVDMYKKS